MPVRQQWTEHIQILGSADFPSYLVTGQRACALVEGGNSLVADWVLRQLDDIPDLPRQVYLVVCHAHADHVSGFFRMKKRRPAFVTVGSKESDHILRKPDIIQKFSAEDRICSAFLKKRTHIGRIAEETHAPLGPVCLDLIKSGNDLLDLGGVCLKFIDTPGHAPGALAVQVAPDDALLISDSAGMIDDPQKTVFPLFFVNYRSYLESLKTLKSLKAGRIGLGHYLQVDGQEACRDFFEMSIAMAVQLRDEIRLKAKQHISQKEIAIDLGERMKAYCRMLGDHPPNILSDYAAVLVRRARE